MRKKLGDWFKVLQLLKLSAGTRRLSDQTEDFLKNELISSTGAGSDVQLEEAYNEIADFYMERQKWDLAIKFYSLGRNLEKQAECYYILEDYANLCKLMDQLPENSELLGV
jgi:WD repeat-containing protein 35